MVTAVTLNPCVDLTLIVSGLAVGGHNETERTRQDVCGKGINVNIVLQHLGVETRALGFEFKGSGNALRDALEKQKIPYALCPVEGEMRVNTKVFDLRSREMTEINSAGCPVTAADVERMTELFAASLPGTDLLVLNGSAPPGVPDGIYRRMAELAHERGIPVVVDAKGAMLRHALEAGPDMIKPNLEEMEQLIGRKLRSFSEEAEACRELIGRGVGAVCLTLGKGGALYAQGEDLWFSPGLEIPVQSLQGAGDSLVAGFCAAMLRGERGEALLRSGVAAAHGSLLHEGTHLCEREDYEHFLKLIPVERR